ncbi:glycosyltransferase [Alloscardovia theropitheci]|uniref:Glycosyltransferase n=1 Tax=Alloscardovia theropitheci TaxID=2496842 RepID=A0A4R0QRH1_9BIFI|nr:glycosyltransferase [Alloscardovia theropitheci]TCD54953.1 glycosyltransferase [Alloscardovia theropitheci]
MDTLTIALVVDTLGNAGNGTSNSAAQFAKELEAEGVHVRLVGVGAPDKRFRAREQYIPIVSEFARPHQVVFAKPDEELFKRAFDGVDAIHIYMPFPFGRAALKYCLSHNVPVTAGFHVQSENIISNAPFLGLVPHMVERIYRWMKKGFYDLIDHIHVPTHMEEGQLVAHGFHQKLHVFSNGYDDALFAERDEEPRWATPERKRFVIVASGRLSEEKSHETLIRAINLSQHKHDIELRIAGAGPREKQLRALASQNLDDGSWSIQFVSHEKMPDFLANANLFVHCSKADIEGISVIEAMAVGVVPVIASAHLSAARDFALCNESLFQVGDARELASLIDYWIDNPSQRAQWGQTYAQHTRKTYSIKQSIHKFIEMEREAIGI